MRGRLARLLALFLLGLSTQALAQPVDVALVLAVDVSGSVDEGRYLVQKSGIVSALVSPEFVEAIRTGPRGAVAVAVVEWSGSQSIVIPWAVIRTRAEAEAIAGALERAPRSSSDYTAVGAAIRFAAALFATAPEADRRVIDVSGDGRNNQGDQAGPERDAAADAGIVINGLPILGNEEGLEDWYRENVQGGEGSFVEPARDFHDFGRAILRKLLLEIS